MSHEPLLELDEERAAVGGNSHLATRQKGSPRKGLRDTLESSRSHKVNKLYSCG